MSIKFTAAIYKATEMVRQGKTLDQAHQTVVVDAKLNPQQSKVLHQRIRDELRRQGAR